MSRTPRWLSRLVVVGAGSAVIATGIVPLVDGVAFAGAGDTATTITLTPDTVTDTVGNCTPYKVQTNANAVFDVQLSETTTQTANSSIGFCNVTNFSQFQNTGDNPVSGPNAGGTNTCPGTTTGTTPATQQTAQCDAQFQADASGDVEFGVTSDSPGTMKVIAYNDQNGNDQFSSNETPNDQSTETWVANQAAGNGISCQPTSQTKPVSTTANWTCTVTTAGGSGVNANTLNVYYDVNSGPDAASFPNDVQCTPDNSNTTGSGGGHNGVYNCSLTNQGGVGTDNITNFVDNNNNTNFDPGEPSANTTATWVNPAPNNSIVTVDCSPNEYQLTTDNNNQGESECQVPLSTKDINFTATVTAGGAPQGGVVVNWILWFDQTQNGVTDPSPASCTTNAQGQCSTSFTNAAPDQTNSNNGNEWAGVIAQVPTQNVGNAQGFSEVNWSNPTPEEARTISVEPSTASQSSGGAQALTATVADRFGNLVPGVCVGWNESGPGRFTNAQTVEPNSCDDPAGAPVGAYGTWCVTGSGGACSVEVTSLSTEQGSQSVTAFIDAGANYDTYTSNTGTAPASECSEEADVSFFEYGNYDNGGFDPQTGQDLAHQDVSRGAPDGVCTDSASVSWTGTAPPPAKKHITASINCFSHKAHVLKCKVTESPAKAGLLVRFKRRTASGVHSIGTDFTNSNGVARLTKRHLKSGKLWKVFAHVYASSTTTGANTGTDRTRIK